MITTDKNKKMIEAYPKYKNNLSGLIEKEYNIERVGFVEGGNKEVFYCDSFLRYCKDMSIGDHSDTIDNTKEETSFYFKPFKDMTVFEFEKVLAMYLLVKND